jgi:hypothetical protein
MLLLLAGLSGCEATEAAERVALVIGNSEYAGAPYLNNPQRDAQAIARALTGIGFQVTGPLLNQSKAQMEAALGRFGQQAQGATAAVVYFAGHGVEVGGQNYLLPTDAVLDRESDASHSGLPSGHPFTGVQSSYYWFEANVANTGSAWNVYLNPGYMFWSTKTYANSVWPVRGGR